MGIPLLLWTRMPAGQLLKPNYRQTQSRSGTVAPPATIRICALRVEFPPDDNAATTGNGQFLRTINTPCQEFVVDPPPHNRAYFRDHIRALANYYLHVSAGKTCIDTAYSQVFPLDDDSAFCVSRPMAYYHPFLKKDSVDLRLAELFSETVQLADSVVDFRDFDVVVILHAGVGQDFDLFLDPTPYDIPSAYLNRNDLMHFNSPGDAQYAGIPVEGGSHHITSGIILPESQNHLLYSNWKDVFGDSENACEYQIGLNGTFAFMFGFYLGLPGLYDTRTGTTGIGKFGLMDQGSANLNGLLPAVPSAWERYYLGWEMPQIAAGHQTVSLSSVGSGSDTTMWKVPITQTEYFLVENRNAHVRPGVSLDSIQYRLYQESGEKSWPSVFPLIRDNLHATISPTTGVLLTAPRYDYGLPGSGLLIWHVDEDIINANLSTNSVNVDRDRRGVDLEEGDGAQDLGYDAGILASNVNLGWYFDPWFAGNEGFFHLNPDYPRDAARSVGFTATTNPSTMSNHAFHTGIRIDSIGSAQQVMSFRITLDNSPGQFPLRPSFSQYLPRIFPIDLDSTDNAQQIFIASDSFYVFNYNGDRLVSANNCGHMVAGISDDLRIITYRITPDLLDLGAWQIAPNGALNLIDTVSAAPLTLLSNILISDDGALFAARDTRDATEYFCRYHPQQHLVTKKAIPFEIRRLAGGAGNIFAMTDSQLVRIWETDLTWTAVALFSNPPSGDLGIAYLDDNDYSDVVWSDSQALNVILNVGTTNQTEISFQGNFLPEIAFGDLDDDNCVETIVMTSDKVYAFNANLLVENNFPVPIPAQLTGQQCGAGLLISDLDGDGQNDILVATTGGLIGFNNKGKLLANFPLNFPAHSRNSGILIDSPSGTIFCGVSFTSGNANSENGTIQASFVSAQHLSGDAWRCYLGNAAGQCFFSRRSQIHPGDGQALLDKTRTFNWPNPTLNDRTYLRYFPQKNCTIKIDIYDLAGELITSLEDKSPVVGDYNEKTWHVTNVASGVYFAVVTASSGSTTETKIVKILVIR